MPGPSSPKPVHRPGPEKKPAARQLRKKFEQQAALDTAMKKISIGTRGFQVAPGSTALPESMPSDVEKAFRTAVVEGYAELIKVAPKQQGSLHRRFLTALVMLVRARLHVARSAGATLDRTEWNPAKTVLVHAATRPVVPGFGEWAWEEVASGPAGCGRVVEVWKDVHALAMTSRNTASWLEYSDARINLDDQFFTAFVAAASTFGEDSPPLARLIEMSTSTIHSTIRAPLKLPSPDPSFLVGPLETLADPSRANFYIRSVELATLCVKARTPKGSNHIESIIRRASSRHEVAYLVDLWGRFREAVDGAYGAEGWLRVEWSEPANWAKDAISNVEALGGREKYKPELAAELEEAADFSSEESLDEDPNIDHGSRFGDLALTQSIVAEFLRSLSRGGQYELAKEIVDWIQRPGRDRPALGMSRCLWTAMIRGLAEAGDSDRAERVYRYMVENDNMEPVLVTDCQLLAAWLVGKRSGSHDFAWGLERTNQFLQTPEVQERYGGTIPMPIYNTILAAMLRNGMANRAAEFLEELIASGIKPSVVAFNNILARMQTSEGKDNIVAAVGRTMARMEELDIEPDTYTFTIVLNALSNAGYRDAGEQLIPMMESMRHQANKVTYGSVVHHLAKSGDVRDLRNAMQVLKTMEKRHIEVTEVTYTTLILGLLRASRIHNEPGFLQHALSMVHRMESTGVKLNRIGYNALIRALLEHGTPQTTLAGKAMFDVYHRERQRNRSKVHFSTYLILLDKLLGNNDRMLAIPYAQQARREGVQGSRYFHQLLDRCLYDQA